jgi:hypothetical protein
MINIEDDCLFKLRRVARLMTVVPTPRRKELYRECLSILADLRRINAERFGCDPYIEQRLDMTEPALNAIAEVGGAQVLQDRSDGEGDCPVCGTPVTKFDRGGRLYAPMDLDSELRFREKVDPSHVLDDEILAAMRDYLTRMNNTRANDFVISCDKCFEIVRPHLDELGSLECFATDGDAIESLDET